MKRRVILLADDSEDDRFLVGEATASGCSGGEIVMVETGQKALDYLAGAGEFADRKRFPEPGLLLLDLKMPVKSGFETLEEVRRSQRWRYLPVVVLTASSQPRDIEKAYRLLANGYLVKPSTLAELTDMMRTVCDFWLKLNRIPEVES